MSDIPEYRVDGRTGKGTWRTLHEWNVINGHEPLRPGEVIRDYNDGQLAVIDPDIIDGEVVDEPDYKYFESGRKVSAVHALLGAAARKVMGRGRRQGGVSLEPVKHVRQRGERGEHVPSDGKMWEYF